MKARPLIIYLHRYPPEHEAVQFSGMRVFLDRLLEKFDVLYVSLRGVKPPDQALRSGLRFLEIPLVINPASGLSKLAKTILFYTIMPWLLRQMRRLEPDFIICKEPLPFIPLMAARLGIPFMIASVSDFWWRILLGGSRFGQKVALCLERFEIRRWNRAGACVVANTRAEASLIEKRGMDPARVILINTTSPVELYFPCEAQAERAQLKLAANAFVVAIHGTIRPGKGYGQLLQWWQALSQAHPDWCLLIIGGAGGEAWCRRSIRHLKLERQVYMTGWLPSQVEVNRWLNAADCLLVIRRNSDDNQGIIPSALYHSLATGKPTVATGLAGISEIVRQGVDGYLFEPDNFASFRAVLEQVAAHPEEAARVGRSGMQREKECFDPVMAAVKNVELIERMIRERR